MKFILTLCLLSCLIGCTQKQEVVTLKIVAIEQEDPEAWGCINTDSKAVVEVVEYGNRFTLCGNYGEVGDVFKGCLVTESFDPLNNGLARFCTKTTDEGE